MCGQSGYILSYVEAKDEPAKKSEDYPRQGIILDQGVLE